MILTCPACGTQYVVKDGAIPPSGRQVRCAACGHSWRQQPEEAGTEPERADDSGPGSYEAHEPPSAASSGEPDVPQDVQPDAASAETSAAYLPEEPQATRAEPLAQPPVPPAAAPSEDSAPYGTAYGAAETDEGLSGDDEPFAYFSEQPSRRRGGGFALLGLGLLLIAAAAAAFWFLAPAEWRERLGIASASQTSLQLMMTHSDRTTLPSGNEYLNISGRVINSTDKQQRVPPIRAELRDPAGRVLYSWTIPPPAPTLPPGGSASFNSLELNVPAGAEELTVTLGSPKA